MKRGLLMILFFLVINGLMHSVNAQNYITGIGVHLGNPIGVNFKYFFTGRGAFEGIAATSWKGYSLTGLYQVHFVFDNPKLHNTHWYIGGGAHIGQWNNTAPFYDGLETYTTLGIDTIIGIESTYGNYPYTFGFNWMPSLNITGNFGINIFQVGMTGRYFF